MGTRSSGRCEEQFFPVVSFRQDAVVPLPTENDHVLVGVSTPRLNK